MKNYFTLTDFYTCLNIGHEIEFLFDEDMFFVQPDYTSIKNDSLNQTINDIRFVLFRCTSWEDNNAEMVFSGTYNEIISFPLKDKMTIKNDFDKFQLHCIL